MDTAWQLAHDPGTASLAITVGLFNESGRLSGCTDEDPTMWLTKDLVSYSDNSIPHLIAHESTRGGTLSRCAGRFSAYGAAASTSASQIVQPWATTGARRCMHRHGSPYRDLLRISPD
jgi:hypothetical protein